MTLSITNQYFVANDHNPATQVWSTPLGAYVGNTNATFETWLQNNQQADILQTGGLVTTANSGGFIKVQCASTVRMVTGMTVYYIGDQSGVTGISSITVNDGTHFTLDVLAWTGTSDTNATQIYSASWIPTQAEIFSRVDDYNQLSTSQGYLAVTSGVDYQMVNTPPLFFDFTASSGPRTVTLPQMNLPGSLAKGRPLYFRVGGSIDITLNKFDGTLVGRIYGLSIVMLELIDNSTQAGTVVLTRFLNTSLGGTNNADQTLTEASAAIVCFGNQATLTAPRTWTLPALSTMFTGGLLLASDDQGGVTATNTITVVPAGGDLINNGALANIVLNRAHDFVLLLADRNLPTWAVIGGKNSLVSADLADLPIVQGYIAGLALSTAGGSTTMSIAAGVGCSDDNTTMIQLAALSKTTSAWALGSGNGGLDTGTIAASTWYHFFAIKRIDTGVVDALISLSATAPTLPTNYTKQRRIGSGFTDGSKNWTKFIQDADIFRWDTGVNDVNATNPGTAAVTRTLTVPTGVNVWADMVVTQVDLNSNAGPGSVYISDLAVADNAANANTAVSAQVTDVVAAGAPTVATGSFISVRTNTSAQVRSRMQNSNASISLIICTLGWTDRRGAR